MDTCQQHTPPKRPNVILRNGVSAILSLALLALGGLAAVVSAALAAVDGGCDERQDAEL
jgi:hypothetical protein